MREGGGLAITSGSNVSFLLSNKVSGDQINQMFINWHSQYFLIENANCILTDWLDILNMDQHNFSSFSHVIRKILMRPESKLKWRELSFKES